VRLLIQKLYLSSDEALKKASHRSPDMKGVQILKVRWPLFLLNHLQTVYMQALLSDTCCVQSPCMHLANLPLRPAAVVYSLQLETKASSHEEQCIPAAYCHTNAHSACGVNNYLNSNNTKYLAQICGRFFAFWKISAANLRILWRHLPTELRSFSAS